MGDIGVVIEDDHDNFKSGESVVVIRVDGTSCPYLCARACDINNVHWLMAYELRKEEFTDIVKQILDHGKV